MSAPLKTNSDISTQPSALPEGRLRNAVWWRFALALAIMALSTLWALTTRTTGVEPTKRPIVHWKFWTRPLEWNPNARKPYLQGDLQASAISKPPQGKAWVYFGGPDGFVVRRGLDDEDWETVPLPKPVSEGQIPTESSAPVGKSASPAAAEPAPSKAGKQ